MRGSLTTALRRCSWMPVDCEDLVSNWLTSLRFWAAAAWEPRIVWVGAVVPAGALVPRPGAPAPAALLVPPAALTLGRPDRPAGAAPAVGAAAGAPGWAPIPGG